MINLSVKASFGKGGDIIQKLIKHMDLMVANKDLYKIAFGIIGRHMIKHSVDAEKRATLVQTLTKLGIDVSKVAMNTERIPNAKAIDSAAYAKGLRQFVLPVGNTLKLTAIVDDPDRMYADILNDIHNSKKPELAEIIKQLLKKANLNPEGGRSGNV